MKRRKSLLIGILLIFTGCTTLNTSFDYDKTINFNQIKTFSWYNKGITALELNSLDKRRILNAVETEMRLKGFKQAKRADILVNVMVVAKDRTEAKWGYGSGGYVFDYSDNEYHWRTSEFGPTNDVNHYTEGTILLDFLDPKTKDLLWRGKASGFKLDDLNNRENRFNSAVKKILMQYPPRQWGARRAD